MIEGIKSYKPEVKASKSHKQLRSYGHSKFCMFSYSVSLVYEECSSLLNATQTPTCKIFDIPANCPRKEPAPGPERKCMGVIIGLNKIITWKNLVMDNQNRCNVRKVWEIALHCSNISIPLPFSQLVAYKSEILHTSH